MLSGETREPRPPSARHDPPSMIPQRQRNATAHDGTKDGYALYFSHAATPVLWRLEKKRLSGTLMAGLPWSCTF